MCVLAQGKKRLLQNFVSLAALQGTNYIFPLITLPYLLRVLGPEKFGLIAFAQVFIQFFIIFTDYGFNFSATREVSIHRDDRQKISGIFSSVFLIKFGLMIVSFIVMNIIVFNFSKFRSDWLVYFFAFGVLIGSVLFPGWLFQGTENMKYITFFNMLSRIIFTICVFIFVKKRPDYFFVPLINSASEVVSGSIAIFFAFKKFTIDFGIPSLNEISRQLKDGWHVFVSTAAISAYNDSRIFVIGLFTSNIITGYYAISERLIGIIQMFPLSALLQTVYPRLSKIYCENPSKSFAIMKRFQICTTFAYIALLPPVFFFAPQIVQLISGAPYSESILAFRLLLVAVLLINANAFQIQFLLVSGRAEIYAKIHLLASLLGVGLLLFGVSMFSYVGAPVSTITVNFIILFLTFKKIYREFVISDALR